MNQKTEVELLQAELREANAKINAQNEAMLNASAIIRNAAATVNDALAAIEADELGAAQTLLKKLQ